LGNIGDGSIFEEKIGEERSAGFKIELENE
jgi:hypothetical protein